MLWVLTDVLGFEKKTDMPMGPSRWLTLVSPGDANDVELLLDRITIRRRDRSRKVQVWDDRAFLMDKAVPVDYPRAYGQVNFIRSAAEEEMRCLFPIPNRARSSRAAACSGPAASAP
jgi:hypothetical protein